MKTKMKKCGVYAAFATVLLVMAALVTGCPESVPGSSGYQPPAGMGAVQLNFNEKIERATILPDSVTIASFPEFILTFTAAGGGASTQTITRTNATKDDPINLVQGSYNVVVVARLIAGDATSAAAVWSSPTGTPLAINAGTVTPYPIALKPYDPAAASEPGKFAWTITNSITGGIGSIGAGSQMSLTTLAGGGVTLPSPDGGVTPGDPAEWNLTIAGNWNNATGEVFPSNYYYVDITLIANGVTRHFRHVLHIYQNMKSTFNYTFTNDHIGITSITFTPDITYVPPTDNAPTIVPAAISTASPVNGVAGNGTVATPYLISLADAPATAPIGLTITVSNSTTFTGSVKYYLGSTVLGSGASLTINTSTAAAPFNATGGPYQITVEGTIGATNGVPYYTEIFVKVVP